MIEGYTGVAQKVIVLYYDWYCSKAKLFNSTDVRRTTPSDYQKHNMIKVWQYFNPLGWALEAVAAMIGNMMRESSVNPWLFEHPSVEFDNEYALTTESGCGLTQWTPARKFISDYAATYNLNPATGETQCSCIEWERANKKQWDLENYGHTHWDEFAYNTKNYTVEQLARVFLWAYERPGALPPDQDADRLDARQKNARWAYNYLVTNPSLPYPEPDQRYPALNIAVLTAILTQRQRQNKKPLITKKEVGANVIKY